MWVLGKIRAEHQILLQKFVFIVQVIKPFRVHSDQKNQDFAPMTNNLELCKSFFFYIYLYRDQFHAKKNNPNSMTLFLKTANNNRVALWKDLIWLTNHVAICFFYQIAKVWNLSVEFPEVELNLTQVKPMWFTNIQMHINFYPKANIATLK